MVIYVPGTEETDLKKVIMSLQQVAGAVSALQTGSASLTSNNSFSGTQTVTNTTASTSTTTGALTVAGGAAVSNQLSVGGKLLVNTSVGAGIGSVIELNNSNGQLSDAVAINFVDSILRGQLKMSVDRSPFGADLIYYGGASGTTERFRIRDDNIVACAGDLACHPSASVTPINNGDLMFQATSNTSLTFKYKGSDGVVRSGSVTLA